MHASRIPWAAFAVAGLTVLASAWFLLTIGDDLGRQNTADLRLWSGSDTYLYIAQSSNIGFLPTDLSGEFHPYQLLTYALLHDSISGLILNTVFIVTLGALVNQAIGHVRFIISYFALAALGGLIQHFALRHSPTTPLVGASSAVMGLAGMVIIICPQRPLDLAAPLRAFLPGLTWPVRGAVLALLWIIIRDVFPLAFRWPWYIPYFAHATALAAGIALALLVISTTPVEADSSDDRAHSAHLPHHPAPMKY